MARQDSINHKKTENERVPYRTPENVFSLSPTVLGDAFKFFTPGYREKLNKARRRKVYLDRLGIERDNHPSDLRNPLSTVDEHLKKNSFHFLVY